MAYKNNISPLERIGMEARRETLRRNEWVKDDYEYTKPLVQSEYLIQDEFKVS